MKIVFQLLLIVVLSFLFYLFLTREVYLTVMTSGHSMEPNFHDGGRLSASKLPFMWRNPHKGDVVLIREYYGINMGDGLIDIKRIAAVGGDTVTNKNGVITIPKDQYYVLGDNAEVSFDSRFYGPLHKDQVLAIVNQ